MSESRIERTCVAWVKNQGGETVKLLSAKGWPDRVFIKAPGKHLYVEFKAPGKKPSQLQEYVMQHLKKLGCNVIWTSSVMEFKDYYHAL